LTLSDIGVSVDIAATAGQGDRGEQHPRAAPERNIVKRVVAVLVAAVLAVSLAGFQGASASPSPRTVRTVSAYTPTLSWHSCGGTTTDQCADFAVPLDHANPDGPQITLAVRMRPHTSTTSKGVILVNPGGPGGSGTGLVVLQKYVPGNVGDQYDWIGWDPRGVGDSKPALSCNKNYFGADRPNFVPKTRALMRYWKKKTRHYADQCGASTAAQQGLLSHMSTLDNVKDMESLRQALVGPSGDLNFYGFSYGSYLGQVYATQYPDHVGRFVLDGIVNPTDYWYGANLKQERGFDRNINIFFKWIAKHPKRYHLGTSWRAIRAGYYRMVKSLDRHPAAHGRLGPDELADAMLSAGYYVYQWDDIATAYSKLVRKRQGTALFRMYADANMGDDNGYAVYLGVQCTDVLRPPWRKQVRDAWRIHRRHPFLTWDNTWFNAPCVNWPAASQSRLAVNGAATAAAHGKVLLINETKDAATPYSGALTVRGLFPSSALIAGVGGTTHAGSLSGVSCVDDRIATFLDTGALPTRLAGTGPDVRCPKVPVPSGRYARTTTGGGLPPALRAQLFAGQLVG
jgi:pimeloyl-ACP methyl ester carboxylesterase